MATATGPPRSPAVPAVPWSSENGHSAIRTGPEGTFAWGLTRRENTFGDVIDYTYVDGLLDRITFGGNTFTGDPAEYEVVFDYDSRECVRTSYRSGFLVEHDRRLAAIDVKHEGEVVRRTELAFEDRCPDLLSSVTVRGWSDDGVEVTDVPWSFTYHDDAGFTEVEWPSDPFLRVRKTVSEFYWEAEEDGDSESEFEQSSTLIAAGNANGDPLPDLIGPLDVLAGQTLDRWTDPSSPIHAFDATAIVDHGRAFASLNRAEGYRGLVDIAGLVDVNGDGGRDYVFFRPAQLQVGIASWDLEQRRWKTPEFYDAPWCTEDHLALNGTCWMTEGKTSRSSVDRTNTGTTRATFAELNGDGLMDYIRRRQGSAGWDVYLNTGRGWTAEPVEWSGYQPPELMVQVEDTLWQTFCTETMLGDVDGDGLVDVVDLPAHAWARNTRCCAARTGGAGAHQVHGERARQVEPVVHAVALALGKVDAVDVDAQEVLLASEALDQRGALHVGGDGLHLLAVDDADEGQAHHPDGRGGVLRPVPLDDAFPCTMAVGTCDRRRTR